MHDEQAVNPQPGRALAPLVYEGQIIHERGEMLSLTDMWAAARQKHVAEGGDPAAFDHRRPDDWKKDRANRAFMDHIADNLNALPEGIWIGKRGVGGGTWAHWQIGLAYAKFISPEFHAWCNAVVRAYMEGRVAVAPDFDGTVTNLSPAVQRAVGGIVKGIVHGEVAEAVTTICAKVCERMLPDMVAAQLAHHNLMIRRGRTAGQVYREAGFPPLKGIAGWFGNRLALMECTIEGNGRAEMGSCTARLFDPDKAHRWLENGGRTVVERKLAERRGQPVQLQIVGLDQGRKSNG